MGQTCGKEFPGVENLAKDLGFTEPPGSSKADESGDLELDLQGLAKLKRSSSEPEVPANKFKRGDQVTVVKRMTWHMPHKADPDFHKDINPGLQGEVEGFTDEKQSGILLKVQIPFGGKKLEYTHQANPGNLQLTKDYQNSKNLSVPAKAAPKAKGKRIPEWLLQDSDPEAVRTEVHWTRLLADSEETNKICWLRSRIGICLEALAETVPKYTEKDLLVCHRRNTRGLWKDELWTLRSFAPEELVFAPLVDQLRTSHLTTPYQALVGVPVCGPGAHPEGAALALDGRYRQCIAAPGSVDTSQHTGILFYLVDRSVDESEANMTLEPVNWEYSARLQMPLKKKAKQDLAVEWQSKDLPNVSILVNKKGIQEHTRLVVFKRCPRGSRGNRGPLVPTIRLSLSRLAPAGHRRNRLHRGHPDSEKTKLRKKSRKR